MTKHEIQASAVPSEINESHGHSTAAWTGVGIMLVATAFICLGVVFATPLLWIPGTLIFIVGAVAWPVMTRAGYGEGGPKNRMGH